MSAGGNAAKVEAKYLPKHKQFSRVTVSTDSYGIIKIPACPPRGLEYNTLTYFGLYSDKHGALAEKIIGEYKKITG